MYPFRSEVLGHRITAIKAEPKYPERKVSAESNIVEHGQHWRDTKTIRHHIWSYLAVASPDGHPVWIAPTHCVAGRWLHIPVVSYSRERSTSHEHRNTETVRVRDRHAVATCIPSQLRSEHGWDTNQAHQDLTTFELGWRSYLASQLGKFASTILVEVLQSPPWLPSFNYLFV